MLLIGASATEVKIVSSIVDITQEEQIQAFVDRVVELFGRIDYAVNSAG